MTFELDLYRQGYLAVTLPILWIVYTCGTNKTHEKMMCHIFAVKGVVVSYSDHWTTMCHIFAVNGGCPSLITEL